MADSAVHGSSLNDKLLPPVTSKPPKHNGENNDSKYGAVHPKYERPSLHDITTREFYQKEGWVDGLCEALFKIKGRNTTIRAEVYHGVIHFISCLYCLAVVPQQLSSAGYNSNNTVVAVALCVGVGSIFCGVFANLPFVLAPPTAVTIFQSVFLQSNNLGPGEGNFGVILSGALLMLFGWRPLAELVKHLIPVPIQVGTVVGVGLLTTLAGSTEVDFVIAGRYKILRMGHITPEIIIVFAGVIVVCVAMRFHIKGSFCIAVVVCSVSWWIYDRSFPDDIFAVPTLTTANLYTTDNSHLPLLTIDLLFLYVLYLNGLVNSLSQLAVLNREDGSTPRGRWVFIMSGFFTILSGLITSAPILVSPESSAAIKEGARTGLSAVVAGVMFLFAAFLGPLFKHIPASGTSPVLIMIGLILFQNVNRIDWRNVADAAPAFVVLFYIPFTYSIIQGVILGYIMYLSITLCTGELLENLLGLYLIYFPAMEPTLMKYDFLHPYLLKQPSAYRQAATEDFHYDEEHAMSDQHVMALDLAAHSTYASPPSTFSSIGGGTTGAGGGVAGGVAGGAGGSDLQASIGERSGSPQLSAVSGSMKRRASSSRTKSQEVSFDMTPSMAFAPPQESASRRQSRVASATAADFSTTFDSSMFGGGNSGNSAAEEKSGNQ